MQSLTEGGAVAYGDLGRVRSVLGTCHPVRMISAASSGLGALSPAAMPSFSPRATHRTASSGCSHQMIAEDLPDCAEHARNEFGGPLQTAPPVPLPAPRTHREAVLALDQGSLPCGELAGNPAEEHTLLLHVRQQSLCIGLRRIGGPTSSDCLSECCLRPAEPL